MYCSNIFYFLLVKSIYIKRFYCILTLFVYLINYICVYIYKYHFTVIILKYRSNEPSSYIASTKMNSVFHRLIDKRLKIFSTDDSFQSFLASSSSSIASAKADNTPI